MPLASASRFKSDRTEDGIRTLTVTSNLSMKKSVASKLYFVKTIAQFFNLRYACPMPTKSPQPIERDACMYQRVLHVNHRTGNATYGECQCPDIPCQSCSAPTNYHEFFKCEGCEQEFCLACLPVYEPRKMRFCPKCADEAKRWDDCEHPLGPITGRVIVLMSGHVWTEGRAADLVPKLKQMRSDARRLHERFEAWVMREDGAELIERSAA